MLSERAHPHTQLRREFPPRQTRRPHPPRFRDIELLLWVGQWLFRSGFESAERGP
jgi:hypothetical protein